MNTSQRVAENVLRTSDMARGGCGYSPANTTRFFLYNDTRALMLRQKRRVFFRRVVLGVAALMTIAFVQGYLAG